MIRKNKEVDNQQYEHDIANYLIDHPNFFMRHRDQLEQIKIPHANRGTISLVEWQLSRQRKRIQQLEEEISQLMEQALINERLFNQLILLQHDLMQATDIQDLQTRLHQWAKSMGLLGVVIRLFSDKWQLNAPSKLTYLKLNRQNFEMFRIKYMADKNQYLGAITAPEIILLMPGASNVGSIALSLLGKKNDLGLVIFVSKDKQHYQSDMGTLILEHISLFLPTILNRWIETQ